MKQVVITGPTGAVGVGLVRACIREGARVYALVRPGSPRIGQLPRHPLVQVVPVDIRELEKAKSQLPKGCEVFYHLAWEGTFGDNRNNMELQVTNIRHTLDAVKLAVALGCKAFVGAGSQAEYGRVEGDLTPQAPTFPENGYGMAKLCAGQMSRELCRSLGIRHVWTRILSVYGPCDGAGTMIMSTIRRLLAGECPPLTAGEQQWDYLYSKDAGRALYLLGEKGKDGAVYCLGSGKARPLREYIVELRDVVALGAQLGFGAIPYGPGQVMRLCADISTLTRDTGFVPEYSFGEGIRETCAWVQEQMMRQKHQKEEE
ncbi:MAG: NAD(P)-dependent oxidoreductase [Lachnospiraceae bacterium]|nr:NAD(P)-dependent oxidoreductase [Lachnospiraceae bacterium]